MELPFQIKVYDKNFAFQAFVGDPISLVVTPRYNRTGTATLVVDLKHHALPYLLAEGARMVITLRGQHLMSGKIHKRDVTGPLIDGTVSLYLKDDFRLLHQILGWPVPTSPATNQSAAEYAVYTGNAETILKNVVTANIVNRLGMPVTVAANQNRGGTPADGVKFRFHPLYEQLYPAIENAGIGVTFIQTGTTIVCDVFTPPVFGFTLTEESGMISDWAFTDDDPTVSRVVAGGQGEGTARAFRDIVGTGRETKHRDVWEDYTDARDAATTGVLYNRASAALDAGLAKSGFAVSLSETEHFQYGRDGLVVGAQVTISVGNIARTDILREVTLSYTRDQGLVTTPVVGDITDSPDRIIAKYLARLKKGITDLKVSK